MKKELGTIALAIAMIACHKEPIPLPTPTPVVIEKLVEKELENRIIGVKMIRIKQFTYLDIAYDLDLNGIPDLYKIYLVRSEGKGWFYVEPNPIQTLYDKNEDGRDDITSEGVIY